MIKRLLDKYLLEKKEVNKWSGGIQTKYEPPKGLFTRSAEDIATQLHADSKDLSQAMSRLNFYENRAGSNLSPKVRKELERAKELLRQKFKA